MKDENKLNVRMLSDVCMQSRLLKEALESKLPLALEITPFSDLWLEENKPESRNIQMLMIDYSRISDDVLTDYSSFKHISCPDAKEVIITVRRILSISCSLSGIIWLEYFILMMIWIP
ncbi:transcriptional regulator, LuxR family [Vibrio cholerae]|nr:transcriptional regulator, LuxR family [Vibrio cholerae]